MQATTKNKLYGCLSKTLVNVAKAVKSGRKNSDKLVEVTLNAVQSLDNETLLKAGSDLANLCALGLEQGSNDAESAVFSILNRVGRLDNDLVVLTLKNKTEMVTQPKLTTDVLFDLVKYYFKSQAPAVDKEMKEILGLALAGSFKTCRAVTSLLVTLHQDSGVE